MNGGAEPNKWRRLFADHPASLHESYWQHSRAAWRIGIRLLGMGIACLCHAVVPGVFEQTASQGVSRLAGEMSERRGRLSLERVKRG
jgi:hypothetical protein